jgi:hypothetical protein
MCCQGYLDPLARLVKQDRKARKEIQALKGFKGLRARLALPLQ